MKLFLLSAGLVLFLALACLLTAYICFYIAFYAPRKKIANTDEISIPDGDIYEPFREQMVSWVKETRALPHE